MQIQDKNTGIKHWAALLLSAFVFNWIWEHFHSVLYIHYKGGEITDPILFRASIWDAVFIFLIILASYVIYGYGNYFFIAVAGLVLAIGIEKWALSSGRWAYGADMPVIPLIQTGLTPTIQLALLGSLAYFISTQIDSIK